MRVAWIADEDNIQRRFFCCNAERLVVEDNRNGFTLVVLCVRKCCE